MPPVPPGLFQRTTLVHLSLTKPFNNYKRSTGSDPKNMVNCVPFDNATLKLQHHGVGGVEHTTFCLWN